MGTIRDLSVLPRRICLADAKIVRPTPAASELFPTCLFKRSYATERDSKSSLTEDILKSRIGDIKEAEKSQPAEENPKTGDDKDGKKKESWFSGKHSWKLGLLFMGVLGLSWTSMAVYLWGMYV